MADHLTAFLDFRPLTARSGFHLLFLPANRYSNAFRSYRRPLHLPLLAKSSSSSSPPPSNFDVISTHEHPDGSLLFKFGDPVEVAKNLETEESSTAEEEAETLGIDGNSGVEVFGKGHEDVTVDSKLFVTEEGDEANSGAMITGISDFEQEDNGSNDRLFESLNDVEIPVSVSNEETDVGPPSVDVEEDISNIEKAVGEKQNDSSSADMSMFDKGSADSVHKNVVTEIQNETIKDEAGAPSSVPEMNPHQVIDDQNLQLGESSVIDTNDLIVPEAQDVILGIESKIDIYGTTTVPIPSSVVFENQVSEFESGFPNEIVNEVKEVDPLNIETFTDTMKKSTEDSPVSEIETRMPNKIVNDVKELEPLLKETVTDTMENSIENSQVSEIEAGYVNDIVNEVEEVWPLLEEIVTETMEKSTEDCVSEIDTGLPNEIVNEVKEVEPLLKETVFDAMETSLDDNGAEILISDFIGQERSKRDNNVQNGNLVEASADEGSGMKSIESSSMSEDISVVNLTISSGAALFPHPSKVLTGGEDAYFIAGQTWFGVADGVGCWSPEGTSPGVFSRELTRTCERLVSSVENVAELLDLSIAETRTPGSSTILVAHFDGQALHVANIGDSGFIILRHGTVYLKSSPMYHAFHFPLQVEQGRDELASHIAEFYKVNLEEGDVIITATDGLFDNLYDQEIASTVANSLAAGKGLEEIAVTLAKNAQVNGGCAYGRSPFADDAQAAGYRGYTGGKLDDVAIIVSVVRMQSTYKSAV